MEIEANVKGKTTHNRTALKNLRASGRVVESGAGSKGHPLHYDLARTREQEPQNRMSTGDVLVPERLESSRVLAKERENGGDNLPKWRFGVGSNPLSPLEPRRGR